MRCHKALFPTIGSIVAVRVERITDICVEVSIPEYDDISAMIQFSELSRKRIRSVHDVLREGQIKAVVVLSVNTEKGYIDMSIRHINRDDAMVALEQWNMWKTVDLVLRSLAEHRKESVESLYNRLIWNNSRTASVHPYFLFQDGMEKQIFPELFGFGCGSECGNDLCLIDDLEKIVLEKFPKRSLSTSYEFQVEVSCIEHPEGVDVVKNVLSNMKNRGNISVYVLAPPIYRLVVHAKDSEEAENMATCLVQEAYEQMPAQGSVCQLCRVTKE